MFIFILAFYKFPLDFIGLSKKYFLFASQKNTLNIIDLARCLILKLSTFPMESKQTKSKHRSYFHSPKKEHLVKKMIFDSHQATVPSSCYELRPINESESNQHDIIFDPKSSSMREISEFQKNSPHYLDKIIYGQIDQHIHNENIFLNDQSQSVSANYGGKGVPANQSCSQNSNPLKRENPLPVQEAKKYQNIVKMFQVVEQCEEKQNKSNRYGFLNVQNKHELINYQSQNLQNQSQKIKYSAEEIQKTTKKIKLNRKTQPKISTQSTERTKKQDFHSKPCKLQEIKSNNPSYHHSLRKSSPLVKLQELSPEIQFHPNYSIKKKVVRKVTENSEFELINQFTELMSYSSLIQDLIAVYDKSPLFQSPLDFDSQQETPSEEQNMNSSINRNSSQKDLLQNLDEQVKIEEISMEIEIKNRNHADFSSNLNKIREEECFSLLEQMRIDEASEKEKKKVLKEIKFQHSKTYINFQESIQELKPYIKRMSLEEKKMFLLFKKEMKQTKDIIEYFQKKNMSQKKEHICKVCGQEFDSGRQLGGHMSRKHPGKALQYVYKKELRKVKEIQRNRRNYFKTVKEQPIHNDREQVFNKAKEQVSNRGEEQMKWENQE